MKKTTLIFTILTLLISLGCEPPAPEEDTPLEHQTENFIHKMKEGDLEIMIIEGCEYFIYKEVEGSNHGFGYMAHKGNCKNPIHCYRTIDMLPDALEKDSTTLPNSDIKK